MALVAPRGRTPRSAEALLRTVRRGFAALPADRLSETEIAFTDALLAACALFSLPSPSLLAVDNHRGAGTLGPLSALAHGPCAPPMPEILAPVSPEAGRPLCKSVCGHLQRGQALAAMRCLDADDWLALDGTASF